MNKIAKECKYVSKKMIKNWIENIEDQNQRNGAVEFASACGFTPKCYTEEPIKFLKQFHSMYGRECTHKLSPKNKPNCKGNYNITIRFPLKSNYMESGLPEFN